MSWTSLTTVGWVQAWNNGYYAIYNYVYYQVNEETRQLRVQLANQMIKSLNAYYSFSKTGVNNGYQLLNYSSTDTVMGYPTLIDVEDSVTVSGGGEWVHSGDRNCGAIYNYNDDGSLPTVYMCTQWITGVNRYNTPEFDWSSIDIKSSFPTITKKSTVDRVKVNVNGTAKSAKAIYVNVNGTAKKVTSAYVNVNGTAKKIF